MVQNFKAQKFAKLGNMNLMKAGYFRSCRLFSVFSLTGFAAHNEPFRRVTNCQNGEPAYLPTCRVTVEKVSKFLFHRDIFS